MRAGRGLSSKITLAILINQRLRKCITGQRIMLGTGLSPVCALVLVREVSLNSGDSPWLGFSHNTGIGNEPSALPRTGHWWRGQSPTLFMRAGRGLSSKITLAILINQRLRKSIAGQRIMLGTGLSPVFALVLVREVSLNSGDSPVSGITHNTSTGNEYSAPPRTEHWRRGQPARRSLRRRVPEPYSCAPIRSTIDAINSGSAPSKKVTWSRG